MKRVLQLKNSILKKDRNEGSTMVEVLMGFVLLTLMLGMLSSIISIAGNMYESAVDMRHNMDRLEEHVYKSSVMDELRHENAGSNITLSPSKDMPLGQVDIDIKADMYEVEYEDLSVYLVKPN